MTFFISDLHADLRKALYTRRGATHNPKDIAVGLHKKYTRMEKVALPQPQYLDAQLIDVLNDRRSYVDGSEEGTIPLETWGTLLGMALRKKDDSHLRPYPSGGGLYPIETYLLTSALQGSAPAAYHYNPTSHALEKLWTLPENFNLKNLARKPDELFFSSLIVFTSCWERSSAKYGDFSYILGLLEAGHMSQNVLLVAAALGVRARPMGAFDDQKIVELLDIGEEQEQILHLIVLKSAIKCI